MAKDKDILRLDAQDKLMSGMQVAISNEENVQLKKAMVLQFRKIEKLFGYEENSWNEGV